MCATAHACPAERAAAYNSLKMSIDAAKNTDASRGEEYLAVLGNVFKDRHWSWTFSHYIGFILIIWIVTLLPSTQRKYARSITRAGSEGV